MPLGALILGTWLLAGPPVSVLVGEAALDDLRLLAPPEVTSVVYLRDVPGTLARLRGSAFQDLYRDPRAAPFLAPLRRTLERHSQELAALFGGATDRELERLFAGGALLAVIESPGSDQSGHLVIIEHDGRPETIARLKGLAPGPSERIQESRAQVGDLEFTRLRRIREVVEDLSRVPSKRPPARAASPLETVGGRPVVRRQEVTEEDVYADERLVIRAHGPGFPMREALRRLAAPGQRRSLATSAAYQGAVGELAPEPDVEFYFDLQRLTETGRGLIDPALLGENVNPQALGLDELVSAAASLRWEPTGLRFELAVYVPPPRRGLGAILLMDRALATRAEQEATFGWVGLIPPDSVAASSLRVNLPALWREFRSVLTAGAPDVQGFLELYLQIVDQSGGIDFENDVLQFFGGRWIVLSRLSRRTGLSTSALIAVRDGRALRPGLERWLANTAALLNFGFERHELRGRPLYWLVGAETTQGALIPLAPLAYVCLAEPWLIFAPALEDLEAILKSLESPGAPPKGLVQTMDPDRFYEAYVSPAQASHLLTSPFLRVATSFLWSLTDSVFDFQRPPPPTVLAERFDPAVFGLKARPAALYGELVMPYRRPTSQAGGR